jgi:drug/metabolite transporter, DME family
MMRATVAGSISSLYGLHRWPSPASYDGIVTGSQPRQIPVGASLIAISAGIIWSFGALAARKADSVDAWQYLMWRSIAVVAVMEALALFKHRRLGLRSSPTVIAWTSGRTMAIANVGLFGASLGYVYAVKTTTAANAAFLSSITPLVAVVIARVVLGERLTRVTVGAIGLATVGLIIMVSTDVSAGNMAGNISALASSIGFAVFTVCLRSDPSRDWGPVLAGYGAAMIAVCSAVVMVNGEALLPAPSNVGLAVFHGGVLIIVGTFAYNYASRHVPAVPMTVFAQSETVFAPFWVFVALRERPQTATLFGAALILTAIVGKAVLTSRPCQKTLSPTCAPVQVR